MTLALLRIRSCAMLAIRKRHRLILIIVVSFIFAGMSAAQKGRAERDFSRCYEAPLIPGPVGSRSSTKILTEQLEPATSSVFATFSLGKLNQESTVTQIIASDKQRNYAKA